jgi:hypothetical protein
MPAHVPLPRGRLLDVISEIPLDSFDTGGNDLRWIYGLKWQPWPCTSLDHLDSDCNPANMGSPKECTAAVEQFAFQLVDSLKASALEMNYNEIDAYLAARIPTTTSAGFASELISATGSGGLSLASEATAPTDVAFGAAAKRMSQALAALEGELAERLEGGRGMLHIPPTMLAEAISEGEFQLVNGQWETASGHLVVSDAGYVNAAPPAGQAASSITTDWMYASGPVYYRYSTPEFLGEGFESVDFTRDRITRWLTSYGILVFDPCPVTAVLVSYDELIAV